MSVRGTWIFPGQPAGETPIHIWNQRLTEQCTVNADDPERECSGQNAYAVHDPALFKNSV